MSWTSLYPSKLVRQMSSFSKYFDFKTFEDFMKRVSLFVCFRFWNGFWRLATVSKMMFALSNLPPTSRVTNNISKFPDDCVWPPKKSRIISDFETLKVMATPERILLVRSLPF